MHELTKILEISHEMISENQVIVSENLQIKIW